ARVPALLLPLLGHTTLLGIKHKKRAPRRARRFFRRAHQRARNAALTKAGVDEKLLDFRTMQAILLGDKRELYRARHVPRLARNEQYALTSRHLIQGLKPILFSRLKCQRRQEADRRAAMNCIL